MAETLRDRLDLLGATVFDVVLPGDSDVAPLEGALGIQPVDDGWALVTVDYGTPVVLGMADTQEEAGELLVSYLDRPLPSPRPRTVAELDALAQAVAVHYFDLRDRATAAGSGGIVIDLPAGILLDRIGALDGVQLYPLDTPLELRSLPPTALRPENDVHRFVTAATVRVRAAIAAPWFGRPGGGLRFTLQQPRTGIRDLIVSGALERFVRVA